MGVITIIFFWISAKLHITTHIRVYSADQLEETSCTLLLYFNNAGDSPPLLEIVEGSTWTGKKSQNSEGKVSIEFCNIGLLFLCVDWCLALIMSYNQLSFSSVRPPSDSSRFINDLCSSENIIHENRRKWNRVYTWDWPFGFPYPHISHLSIYMKRF